MSEQSQYGLLLPPDSKRRKVEGEAPDASQAKGDRRSALDKAKANYLSGQLRLRLQYARLKVEHGWQRQSLSEVENLYFRHTHLTRPYPVISPGGRRNGRTLSSTAATAGSSAQHFASSTDAHHMDTLASQGGIPAAGTSLRPNASLASTSSSSSIDTHVNSSIPSTPILDAGRTATPHAPHLGFGHTVTRYPVSRSDSTATVIIDSAPTLQHTKPSHSHAPHTTLSSNSFPAHLAPQPSTASPFREPFDPMEPTEHIDSQLAALRSMMTTSAMPIPLPPPQAAPAAVPPSGTATSTSSGAGAGLTYDSFWSSHASATSYRAMLSSQASFQISSQDRSAAQLQAYASAPAALTHASTSTSVQNGSDAHDRS